MAFEDRQDGGVNQEFNAARGVRRPTDESRVGEREDHLVHSGRRDAEVPLEVRFRKRACIGRGPDGPPAPREGLSAAAVPRSRDTSDIEPVEGVRRACYDRTVRGVAQPGSAPDWGLTLG